MPANTNKMPKNGQLSRKNSIIGTSLSALYTRLSQKTRAVYNRPMSFEKQAKKRLVILDSHAILHRAYHALPEFSSARGEPTGALYGLSTTLLKMADELKPDYIIAARDLPEPTHRHVLFEDYKGKREKTEDALVVQL